MGKIHQREAGFRPYREEENTFCTSEHRRLWVSFTVVAITTTVPRGAESTRREIREFTTLNRWANAQNDMTELCYDLAAPGSVMDLIKLRLLSLGRSTSELDYPVI